LNLEPETDSGRSREIHEASKYSVTAAAAGGLAGTLMHGTNQTLEGAGEKQ
jgi:hypothetical protein